MVSMRNSMGILALSIVLTALLSGTGWGGDLDPIAPPGPTMKTLDQIPPTWSQILPGSSRFVLVLVGAAGVLDKETGLVWEQSPSNTTKTAWSVAVNGCVGMTKGNRMGWRLPTIEELSSLIDPTQSNPALPSDYPFSNVKWGTDPDPEHEAYWSITSNAFNNDSAYTRPFHTSGGSFAAQKSLTYYFWCVRGGHGIDPSSPPNN